VKLAPIVFVRPVVAGAVSRVIIAAIMTAIMSYCGIGTADVTLPGIFGDNMVLQRNRLVPVWGMADPNETVTVSIDTLVVQTAADSTGRWRLSIGPLTSKQPFSMTVSGPKNTIEFKNILAGEVWICSGQSNMAWTMSSVTGRDRDITTADYPEIRMITVPRVSTTEPSWTFPQSEPKWIPCSPDTVGSFSAVAFYFGREINRDQRTPVGLINTSWGGSFAEAWVSLDSLKADPVLHPLVANMDSLADVLPAETALYQKNLEMFRKATAAGDTLPMPFPPRGPGQRDYPSGLYNAMIEPIVPFATAGVIWYQGESNAERAWQYRTLFPALISNWRTKWETDNLPFLFVQLANWNTETIPVERGWGSWQVLREAQLATLSVPNTGMAVIIDIGDSTNIHPNNKWDVGHRLALIAEQKVYNRLIESSGPIYTSIYRAGASIRLRFRHVGSGLYAGRENVPVKTGRAIPSSASTASTSIDSSSTTGQETPANGDSAAVSSGDLAISIGDSLLIHRNRAFIEDTSPIEPERTVMLTGFVIAGSDKVFHPANARITGDEVVVWSEQVPYPVAARYGWDDNPYCNLYNSEGLPASPFRTDDWDVPTQGLLIPESMKPLNY